MLRLFVAIPLPIAMRAALAGVRRELQGARWTAPERYHLTLRFIGDTPVDDLDAIQNRLAELVVSEIPVHVSGLGNFPPSGPPRVLHARVLPLDPLLKLQASIEAAIVSVGVPSEGKPFRPHITLARLRDADAGAVRRLVREAALKEAFVARRFALFASRLTAEGAHHEVLAWYGHEGRRP